MFQFFTVATSCGIPRSSHASSIHHFIFGLRSLVAASKCIFSTITMPPVVFPNPCTLVSGYQARVCIHPRHGISTCSSRPRNQAITRRQISTHSHRSAPLLLVFSAATVWLCCCRSASLLLVRFAVAGSLRSLRCCWSAPQPLMLVVCSASARRFRCRWLL